MATHFLRGVQASRVLAFRRCSGRSLSAKAWSPALVANQTPKTAIAKASTLSGNGAGNGNGSSSAVNGSDISEALTGGAPPAESAPALRSAPPPQTGFDSEPLDLDGNDGTTDWSKSYAGLSQQPFAKEVADVLLAPVEPEDIEMKPDGLIYLPEIKYRRVLNKAFGPGGWGLAPRGQTNVGPKVVSREYALVCFGRLVAIARGEQEYFDPHGIPTATEAAKSNALMRCCKDLGIASELWDPRFIREFKAKYCIEVFAEHVPTKKKKKLWRRKDQPKFDYPYRE